METIRDAFLIGALLSGFIPATLGYFMAKNQRNRNPWLWFVNCYIAGLLMLLILIVSPTLTRDEELDFQATDTLGAIMFWIGLILTIAVGLYIWSLIPTILY